MGKELFQTDKGLTNPGGTAAVAANEIGKPRTAAKDHNPHTLNRLAFEGCPQMLKLGARFSIKAWRFPIEDQLNQLFPQISMGKQVEW
jgi:hypothetical protein